MLLKLVTISGFSPNREENCENKLTPILELFTDKPIYNSIDKVNALIFVLQNKEEASV